MFENEELLSVPLAFLKVTGKRPHPSTCHRLRTRGIGGVRVQTVKVLGRRLTSVDAVRRFIAATNRADDYPQPPQTNRERQTSLRRARQELNAAGFRAS